MRAFLDNLSVIHNNDAVCINYCGKSVCNNYRGAITKQGLKSFLYDHLCIGVNGARSFIQNKNPRISDNSPGKTHQLPLAGTEPRAPFIDVGVEPLRHVLNEFISVHSVYGPLDILVSCISSSVANVVSNG